MNLNDAPAEIILEALKIKYDQSLGAFTKALVGMKDITAGCHGDMIDCLERPTKLKLIVMPRGTMKTSIASIAYPLWLLTKNPNLRIMLDSEVYTNSMKRLREIRQVLDSRQFKAIYGDWSGPVWNDSELIIKPRTKIQKEATIFASGIGASKTGNHCDVIIADDLNTPLNTNTKENAEKVYEHYKYYTSILDPGGTIVVIGTRYSNMDTIGRIIDNELSQQKRDELRDYERFG